MKLVGRDLFTYNFLMIAVSPISAKLVDLSEFLAGLDLLQLELGRSSFSAGKFGNERLMQFSRSQPALSSRPPCALVA